MPSIGIKSAKVDPNSLKIGPLLVRLLCFILWTSRNNAISDILYCTIIVTAEQSGWNLNVMNSLKSKGKIKTKTSKYLSDSRSSSAKVIESFNSDTQCAVRRHKKSHDDRGKSASQITSDSRSIYIFLRNEWWTLLAPILAFSLSSSHLPKISNQNIDAILCKIHRDSHKCAK